MAALELSIRMEIRKAKIQFYFQEQFKTSYGREGNYSKLIYAQPKS
jgi:hypothetical protein